MTLRVRTGSRLHFGLLSLASGVASAPHVLASGVASAPHVLASGVASAPHVLASGVASAPRADNAGPPSRAWGGAGLMVTQPGLDLEAHPAESWSAAGPLAERVLEIVDRFQKSLPSTEPPRPLHFEVHNAPVEHQGLGTGTQLALAVARILAEWYDLPDKSAPSLARRVGRGLRSALGIHGFDHGGFLVDGGKAGDDEIAPLVARVPFPEEWRIVLILFPDAAGCHGTRETQAFQRLTEFRAALDTDRLCRLVLLDMLPALAQRDLPGFSGALYEFNRSVGEAFRPVQGGVYSHPGAAEMVEFLRGQGIAGVGQSSWGPGLFAVVENEDYAERLARKQRERFAHLATSIIVSSGRNHGNL